jgi:hypothetical protein
MDPAVWLDENDETVQITGAAAMHVTAQQNGHMVLRRAHPRVIHEAQRMCVAAFARRSFNYHIGKREAYLPDLLLADAEELVIEVVKVFRRSHRPKMKRTFDAMLGTD